VASKKSAVDIVSANNPPLRLGVLGAGTAAGLTLSQLAGSPHVQVAAIAGRSPETARAAAAKFGVPSAVAGFEALLADPQIEAVYIALPIVAHAKWAIAALRAGKHVLVEKPATATAAEMVEVEAVRAASGKVFMEGMMVRHHPQWHTVMELIRQGAIGEVMAVQGALTRVPPRADDPALAINRPDLGWSVILDNGCYMVALARLVFGAGPDRVSALGEVDLRFGTLASVSALMHFPKGTASFTVSTKMRRLQRFNILGTEGRIEVMLPVMPVGGPSIVAVDSRDIVPPAPPRELVFDGAQQFRLQMEAFARAARGLEAPVVSVAETLGNMHALDALARSVEQDGAWVKVAREAARTRDEVDTPA
jgi:predicted dehydrogenase